MSLQRLTEDSGTTTRTIRLEREVDALLRRLAGEERVSVNHLVNRSLRRLVEWDALADKFGVISLPASLVRRMMDYLTEEEAREMGQWVGRELVREFLTFWFKEISEQNVLREYPRLNALYGKSFEYEEHQEGDRFVIILKHSAGRKWSVFYGEVVKALFAEVVKKNAAVEISENQVVARFAIA